MLIQIKVPKSVGLKSKIVDKYTFLYKEYRRFYPDRRDYTYRQLRHNILEVAAIVNSFVDDSDIHNTTFIHGNIINGNSYTISIGILP